MMKLARPRYLSLKVSCSRRQVAASVGSRFAAGSAKTAGGSLGRRNDLVLKSLRLCKTSAGADSTREDRVPLQRGEGIIEMGQNSLGNC
jgi:hypothetical protein